MMRVFSVIAVITTLIISALPAFSHDPCAATRAAK